jgi:hypothetical protein
MKIFIWNSVECLTDNKHNGGGCAVVANDLEAARAALLETPGVLYCCDALYDAPDWEADVESDEIKVFIFPDAGCC